MNLLKTKNKFLLFFIFVSLNITSEDLTIMSFNVENLFDSKDNPKKTDDTYLPLSEKNNSTHFNKCQKINVKKWRDDCLFLDWNEKVIEKKIHNILQVLNSKNVDVISFQEVENIEVLKTLQKGLNDKELKHIALIDGQDDRGINLGIISKLPIIKSKLHPINFEGVSKEVQDDTRGILETEIMLGKRVINIYSVHFPAGYHPTSMRLDAFNNLEKLINQHSNISIALGDFNVNITEDTNQNIYKNLSNNWEIAHLSGCEACDGTQYYFRNGTWSFLDNLMIFKGRGARFENDSIEVVKHPLQTDSNGIQIRFNSLSGIGVSDHFPIMGTVSISENAKN